MDQSPPANNLFDISQIAGNALDDIKHIIGNPSDFFQNHHVKDLRFSIFGVEQAYFP
jgi:hypothetical protein